MTHILRLLCVVTKLSKEFLRTKAGSLFTEGSWGVLHSFRTWTKDYLCFLSCVKGHHVLGRLGQFPVPNPGPSCGNMGQDNFRLSLLLHLDLRHLEKPLLYWAALVFRTCLMVNNFGIFFLKSFLLIIRNRSQPCHSHRWRRGHPKHSISTATTSPLWMSTVCLSCRKRFLHPHHPPSCSPLHLKQPR